MSRPYLIRYGLSRSVALFAPEGPAPGIEIPARPADDPLRRGEAVVVRTHRGVELGEVVGEAPGFEGAEGLAPLLRRASADDLSAAQEALGRRAEDYAACLAVFGSGDWPIELIDAEPILEPRRTVIQYLGPHRLDASGLVAAFRDRCGLDVVLEPVGADVDEQEASAVDDIEADAEADTGSCGSCSSGGKGGGGCGSCSSGGGCSIKALVGQRRAAPADPA